MSRDLRKLLDDVALRAVAIEIHVDNRLEQSIAASVRTERQGDAAATFVRHSCDSAAEALEAVLIDAALWCNAQPSVRRKIVAEADPALRLQVEMDNDRQALIAMVRRLAAGEHAHDEARALLARLGAA